MTMISLLDFAGMRPRVHARLLPDNAAQSAINTKLTNGKLRAFMGLKQDGVAANNPPLSIYRQRETSGWLDWATDVDVIRSPLDTDPATLIYTGDGRPQIRAVGDTTHYDLGLPQPVAAPSAIAQAANATFIDITNVSRVVFGSSLVSSPESVLNYTTLFITADGETTYNFLASMVVEFYTATANLGEFNGADGNVNGFVFIARLNGVASDGDINAVLAGTDGSRSAAHVLSRTPLSSWALAPFALGGFVLFGALGDNASVAHLIPGSFLDQPPAGGYTYLIAIMADPGPKQQALVTKKYAWYVEARQNNRTKITTAQDINFGVDSQITISAVNGTSRLMHEFDGTLSPDGTYDIAVQNASTMSSELNLQSFTVAEIIDSKTFTIEFLAEGTYVNGGKIAEFFNIASLETRAYRYTYVTTINGVDYEGPASLASDLVNAGQGEPIIIGGFSPFPGTWNSPADKIRIYRFTTTSSSSGQYQFVDEIPISESTYIDVSLASALAESLPTPDRETPPENLQGLIELPSGGAAGFVGKTLYFAIPNFIHAWPEEYARLAHDDVVALGAFGSSVVIATKGQPYIMNGIDPASMTMDRLELSQPCLSKQGAVDMGYSFLYPSDDGLVMVSTGSAQVVTTSLFTRDEWQQLNPASFVAARYKSSYVCFYIDVDGNRGGFVFDTKSAEATLVFLDFWANAVWTDQADGSLYLAKGNIISRFDDAVIELEYRWRSKDFVTPEVAFTAARIVAAKYPVSMSVFRDGLEVSSVRIYNKKAFRMKTGQGTTWSVEIRGQHEVESVHLAENMVELGNAQGAG